MDRASSDLLSTQQGSSKPMSPNTFNDTRKRANRRFVGTLVIGLRMNDGSTGSGTGDAFHNDLFDRIEDARLTFAASARRSALLRSKLCAPA
jgi:hypothetical protein